MPRPTVDMQEFLADPFGSLKRARDESWLADLTLMAGVIRYAEVRQLLSDPRLRANFTDFLHAFGVTSGPFYEWMKISPLNRDGADHLAWRAVLSRAFTPRRVEQIRPFLKRAAHQLVDAFAARGSCDFMQEFADKYPSLGLCELIGVPHEDRDKFRGWADAIGLGFTPLMLLERIGEIDAALTQLLAYTAELAAARRMEPRDDLITRIVQAGQEDGWTPDMVHGAIAGLVFAGHETTKNQLGWMISILSERQDLWDAVGSGTQSAADVVEEVMRHRSAATGVGRTVAEPIEINGDRLEPGTPLLLSLWSADHDERVFPNPHQMDIKNNEDSPHIAFGHGPHHCLGAALARTELQEALMALSTRLTCPVVGADAVWKPPAGINGPIALPITFAQRAV